ncbi:PREDICTED: actin-binding protein anillin-like [Nicrophorus vespilloides]|uniref:Actin-binding protein anillin-like n=1 Tax=Nicrophorus vespilloides TaxID=110193 RepID=A0ABM1N326_NICVS|nr:PREDICTED: actin-binding protein anillin-like [Nicrophorus vespilloides]
MSDWKLPEYTLHVPAQNELMVAPKNKEFGETQSSDDIYFNLNNVHSGDLQKVLCNLAGSEIHISTGLQKIKFNKQYHSSDYLLYRALEDRRNVTQSFEYTKSDGDTNDTIYRFEVASNSGINNNVIMRKTERRKPIMGRSALIAKHNKHMSCHVEDSRIVQEMVTERFNDVLDSYFQKCASKQQLNSLRNNDEDPTFDENLIKHSSTIEDNSQPTDAYSTGSLERYMHKSISSSCYEDANEELLETRSNDSQTISSISSTCDTDDEQAEVDVHADDFESDDVIRMGSLDCSGVSELTVSINTDNNSVGTSNVSTLLSEAADSESFLNTSDMQDEISETSMSLHEKISNLSLESNIQNQIMIQTSKALLYCKSIKEFAASLEEVEAHRILLISTLKRDLINEELNRLVSLENEEVKDDCYGHVDISNVSVSIQSNVKNNKDQCQWYICVLFSGFEVLSTKIVAADDSNIITFKEKFSFEHLPANFEVNIEIFSLSFKNNSKQTLCISPQNLLKGRKKSRRTITVDTFQTSAFKMIGKSVITINNLKNDGQFKLYNASSAIKDTLSLSLTSGVVLNESFCGFLNVGAKPNKLLIWNRRWCKLQGSRFLSFNFPEQMEPVLNIDLSYCVNSVIAVAKRQICARSNTLLVETLSTESTSADGSNIRRYFLSADNVDLMKKWEAKLNNVLIALRNWKSMNC